MVNSFDNFSNGYNYGYSSGTEMLDGMLGAIFGFLFMFILVILAVAVVAYIFQSLALFAIAKRRMIKNPWLAWLPVGWDWILGSISDQYQYVSKGKIRNRRKVLLWLTITSMVLSALYEIMNTFQVFQVLGGGLSLGWGITAVMMLVVCVGMIGVGVTLAVFYYIALYDLYQSCDPSNSLLYLLLSIFLGVTTPFILFACRKLDRGMPPRKEVTQVLPENTVEVVEEPAATPEETEPAQTHAGETQPEE